MSDDDDDDAPPQINVEWRRWQWDIYNNLKRFNVIVAHRGSGKSVLAMTTLILKALQGPPNAQYLYLCPLKNQAMRNVWQPMLRIVENIPGIYLNNVRLEIVFPHKARIMVLGADDPDALRGLHISYMILDEFGDMAPNIWPVVLPMTTNHRAGVIFIGTPKGRNQFYDKYQESQVEENKKYWQGVIMVPSKTKIFSEEELRLVRSTMSSDMYAQEYDCSFEASNAGAYYTKQINELRTNGNIYYDRPLYDPALEVHVGFDIGMRDFTAVWWFQYVHDKVTGKDNIHFIDFEQSANLGLPDWNSIIIKRERDKGYRRGNIIFPHDIKVREWGANVSRLEAAENLGLLPQVCPDHGIDDRIELMRLHLPNTKFDGLSCEDGIECLAQYKEKLNKNGIGMGVPDKNDGFDHACLVADTLVRTDHGDVRIDQIKVNDMVWTPAGYSRVLAAGPVKQVESIVCIELSDGRALKCTSEHKILTNNGFQPADTVGYDNKIMSGEELSCRLIALLSKVLHIGFRTAITGQMVVAQESNRTYIEQFGKMLTALFQKAITFITSMKIVTTMIYPTYNVFSEVNTYDNTLSRILPMENSNLPLNMRCSKQQNGMQQKKDWSFIEKMAGALTLMQNGIFASVLSVVKTICRPILKSQNTVTTIAKLSQLDVSEAKSWVYDLTIENHHCYQANGCLVSNSDSAGYCMIYAKQVMNQPALIRVPFMRRR